MIKKLKMNSTIMGVFILKKLLVCYMDLDFTLEMYVAKGFSSLTDVFEFAFTGTNYIILILFLLLIDKLTKTERILDLFKI